MTKLEAAAEAVRVAHERYDEIETARSRLHEQIAHLKREQDAMRAQSEEAASALCKAKRALLSLVSPGLEKFW